MSQNYNKVLDKCAKILRMQELPPVWQAEIKKLYAGINITKIDGVPMDQFITQMSHLLIARLKLHDRKADLQRFNKKEQIQIDLVDEAQYNDMHEYLTKEINAASQTNSDRYLSSMVTNTPTSKLVPDCDMPVNSLLNIKNIETLQLLFNPESLYDYHYVVLDSQYADRSNYIVPVLQDDNQPIIWKYSPLPTTDFGYCSSMSPIHDIVAIRMYTPLIGTKYLTDLTLTFDILEFMSDAVLQQPSETFRFYHFIFSTMQKTDNVDLTNLDHVLQTDPYNDTIYRFKQPITSFSSLSILIKTPFSRLTMPEDFKLVVHLEFVCLKSDK